MAPLKGRTIYIWPDNDEPGAKYAERVAKLAHGASAASVSILKLDELIMEGIRAPEL